MREGDERAHISCWGERIAESNAAHQFGDACNDLLVDTLLGVDTCGGSAVLTRVHDRADQCAARGVLNIRVIKDHERRLPAELKVEPLERWRTRRHQLAAGGRVASERDHVNTWIRGELRADLWPRSDDDVHHTIRETDLARKFGETNCGERRCAGRLHDHRVPRGECWGGLPDRHGEWVVPRRNQRCNANRLTPDHGGVAAAEL